MGLVAPELEALLVIPSLWELQSSLGMGKSCNLPQWEWARVPGQLWGWRRLFLLFQEISFHSNPGNLSSTQILTITLPTSKYRRPRESTDRIDKRADMDTNRWQKTGRQEIRDRYSKFGETDRPWSRQVNIETSKDSYKIRVIWKRNGQVEMHRDRKRADTWIKLQNNTCRATKHKLLANVSNETRGCWWDSKWKMIVVGILPGIFSPNRDDF
jgi:hypothetical protein